MAGAVASGLLRAAGGAAPATIFCPRDQFFHRLWAAWSGGGHCRFRPGRTMTAAISTMMCLTNFSTDEIIFTNGKKYQNHVRGGSHGSGKWKRSSR
ncbi:MAG: hypothetical protein ACRECY_08170 [Phyllobacterium sp.]